MSEAERVTALRRYDILDTEPEPQFDHIVELAARMFDAPMAVISFIDTDRLWFKARYGIDFRATPRGWAFSELAVQSRQVQVIRDTTLDARFRDHPHVVGGPQVRFHAAAPIFVADRHPIGAVCVLDTLPRDDLPVDRVAGLQALARLVEVELDRRLAVRRLKEAADRFRDLAEVSSDWVWEPMEDIEGAKRLRDDFAKRADSLKKQALSRSKADENLFGSVALLLTTVGELLVTPPRCATAAPALENW